MGVCLFEQQQLRGRVVLKNTKTVICIEARFTNSDHDYLKESQA